MICESNLCRGGRIDCPTPWTCGRYKEQAAYDDSTPLYLPLRNGIEYAGAEPPMVPSWLLGLLFVAMCAVLGFALGWAL